VEDNEVNQMVAAELLREAGYTCECVGTGKQAIEAVLRSPCDLVLMDCQMPEMDGFEATRAIRVEESANRLAGRSGRLPIIALTANALKGDRERCVAAGMDDYLSKPLQPQKLLATIRSLIRRSSVEDGSKPSAAASTAGAPQSSTLGAGCSQQPPIDVEPLLERCMGRADFAQSVLEMFRTESVKMLEELVRGLKEKNYELTTRSAHTLRGMAATVAAKQLSSLAAEAETRATTGDWDAVERQISALRRELDSCSGFIPHALKSSVSAKPATN